MNLVVDIGNTQTKAGVFKQEERIELAQFLSSQPATLKALLKKHPEVDQMIYACVGPLPGWIDDFRDKMKIFLALDPHTRLPIENSYQSKDTLGYDRIATAVGANNIYPGKDVLIIDAGTAITFDLVEGRGNFAGGNIAPGLKMRFRSLKEFTAGLPLVKPAYDPPLVGKTTHEAIQSGIMTGMIHEMDGMITRVKEKYPGLITVLTGGDSVYFEKKLKNSIFVVQNLNLIGLNRILNYNANPITS